MERESKGPLIDTTNNRKAKKRRIYELQEDHLQLAYNCTLAPNPITIGSMGTETTNSFHQSYVYTLYISSLYILYIMFTVSLYHESDIITSAVNGESKVGWIGMPWNLFLCPGEHGAQMNGNGARNIRNWCRKLGSSTEDFYLFVICWCTMMV